MKRDLELEALVIEEAKNIKNYAKKEEIDNLKYDYLAGYSKHDCIYGQMTGDCESERSYRLIHSCCNRVYSTQNTPTGSNTIISSKLNGKPKQLGDYCNRARYYVSPIEKFLYLYKRDRNFHSTKIKKLVKFLKGEIQELKF